MSQSLDLLAIAIPIAIVLAALTIHEAAHAWSADKLGDPTARLLGRVSFNPLVHIDPIGTVLLPLIAVYSGFPVIGWAKPVPVNTSRLRDPRRDFMLVAAAGPVSNLLQATAAAVVLHLVTPAGHSVFTPLADGSMVARVFWLALQINVLLAVFNLIPVPPLDGGNVLAGLLPPSAGHLFDAIRPFGFIILYALLLTGALSAMILPPADYLIKLLLP